MSYQAIYDAVRSQISGGDIGAAVESVLRAENIGHYATMAAESIRAAAGEYDRPSVLFRPRIYVDGDKWCALYGDGLVFWASKVGTENGTLTAYSAKGDAILVTRGCFLGTAAEFLAKSAKEHDERTHREYGLLLEVAKSRIDAARASTPRPIGDQP